MDEKRFFDAYRYVTEADGQKSGIGTIGEKSLHKILKSYYEPRVEYHEIPFMGFVLDVKNEEGIIEVQTGSFTPLYPKLKKLLPYSEITVICPIIAEKRLIWFDKETGELTEPKRSPKKGRYSDALSEISKISDLLFDKNLTVRLVLLSADEYKYLDGYGKDRKKRATKIERIPRRIIEERDINQIEDLIDILPDLPESFTASDFNKATGLRRRKAFFSLKLLLRLGIIELFGKRGNAYLYRFVQ